MYRRGTTALDAGCVSFFLRPLARSRAATCTGEGGGAGAARDVGEPGDGARERGFRRNVGQPRRSACASQPANQKTWAAASLKILLSFAPSSIRSFLAHG